MTYNNVQIIKKGSEYRAFFEGFDETNDVNKKTEKGGVRCHKWYTAFFHSLVGNIEIISIKGSKGNKEIYLDKASLKEWKKWHKQQSTNLSHLEGLPSIKQIIEDHKATMSMQAAARSFVARNALAYEVQKQMRGKAVRDRLKDLKGKKNEINKIRDKIQKLEDTKNKESLRHNVYISEAQNEVTLLMEKSKEAAKQLQELKEKLTAKQQQLVEPEKEELNNKTIQDTNYLEMFLGKVREIGEDLNSGIKSLISNDQEKKDNLDSIQSELKAISLEYNETSERQKKNNQAIEALNQKISEVLLKEKEDALKGLLDSIDQESKNLEALNREFDNIVINMNRIETVKPESTPDSLPEIVPSIEELDENAAITSEEIQINNEVQVPLSQLDKIIMDVSQHTDEHLGTLVETILLSLLSPKDRKNGNKNISEQIIKKYEFSQDTKKFKVTLQKPGNLWMRPMINKNEPDPLTPKGVIFLLGNNNEMEIEGELDKKSNMISFSKGFESYCKIKKGLTFEVDARISSISYIDGNLDIDIIGKGRGFAALKGEELITQTKDFALTLEEWEKAEITKDNHEKFLSDKPSIV